MKSGVEKTSGLGRKLTITVPADVVNQTFDRYFKGAQKQAQIKGFRPGKAPIATIKSVYGSRIHQDVVQELLQKHYFEAVKQENLNPISYPEFEFDAALENQDFSFSANFEIRPEVQLKKYEGLEIKKEKYTNDPTRVEKILQNIQNSHAEWGDVLEDRPAMAGDMAIIDFDGSVDGKPLEGGKGFDHKLELGSNSFIEGFEEGILGMKIGSEKTLHLKFPEGYHAAELSGKPVEFKVKLKSLKKKTLPDLNDALVEKLMGPAVGDKVKTMADLQADIEKDVEATEKKRIEDEFRHRLLKSLVEANPVDVPKSLLEDQKAALVEDAKKKLTDQGFSDQEFADYMKRWDGDLTTNASQMIQTGFLIDAIAAKHSLGWTEDDMDQKLAEYSKQTGIDRTRIDEFYGEAKQRDRLAYGITEDKVIQFLMSSAKVTEVDAAVLNPPKK